VLVNKSTS